MKELLEALRIIENTDYDLSAENLENIASHYEGSIYDIKGIF